MNTKYFEEYWLDLNNLQEASVIFVGLSHKYGKNWEVLEAFCETTNSWKVIQQLEEGCGWISIHKTNLVKWVPLKNGKIRYPNAEEKKEWLNALLEEISIINPSVVYLFWKQVSDFVIKNIKLEKISDVEYRFWEVTFLLAHHPSYIYLYKRRDIESYIQWITTKISELLE